TRNRATDYNHVLLRQDPKDLEVGDLDALAAHTAGQPFPFHDTRSKRGVTHRPRSTKPVVLAVGLFTHAAKSMALYNTLKSLAFGYPYSVDVVAYLKYILNSNLRTQLHLAIKLSPEIAELYYLPLGTRTGLLEVPKFCLVGVLFLLVSKGKLNGAIAVRVGILDLRDHARASLNYRAGNVFSLRAEYTGHSYLFSYNSRHVRYLICACLSGFCACFAQKGLQR